MRENYITTSHFLFKSHFHLFTLTSKLTSKWPNSDQLLNTSSHTFLTKPLYTFYFLTRNWKGGPWQNISPKPLFDHLRAPIFALFCEVLLSWLTRAPSVLYMWALSPLYLVLSSNLCGFLSYSHVLSPTWVPEWCLLYPMSLMVPRVSHTHVTRASRARTRESFWVRGRDPRRHKLLFGYSLYSCFILSSPSLSTTLKLFLREKPLFVTLFWYLWCFKGSQGLLPMSWTLFW